MTGLGVRQAGPPRRLGFVANSMANLAVGAATLGQAVLVPAVVLRRFGAAQYGSWYLAFQVAAYVVLLDLGSQYVVTNEVATRARRAGAARVCTAAMAAQAVLAVAVVGLAAAWAGLTSQHRLAVLVAVLGLAATASLLASTVRAWFAGLERAHVPAVWLVGARAASVAGLAVAVATSAGLVTLTVAATAPQLAVHAGMLLWARRPPSPWAWPDRDAFTRLGRRSLPLAVWTVCGIVIWGVDVFVVRAVDPSEVGRYAVALPLLAVPMGVVTAAMSAWIPRVAAAEGTEGVGGRGLTLTATTVVAAALAAGAIPFVAFARELVRLWAGPGPWHAAATYLQLLYLAACLRFVFLPWAVLILVRGEQAMITWVPIAEAVVNLAASVVLGVWLGALGVALGTVVGAGAAAVLYLARAIPHTAASGVSRAVLVRAVASAWPPVAATTALVAVTAGGGAAALRAGMALAAVAVHAWWAASRRERILAQPARLQPS